MWNIIRYLIEEIQNSYIAQITISLTKFVETGKNSIIVASEKKKINEMYFTSFYMTALLYMNVIELHVNTVLYKFSKSTVLRDYLCIIRFNRQDMKRKKYMVILIVKRKCA